MNYLSVPVDFGPVEAARKRLEEHLGVLLQHRGEAHITVLSPKETRAIQDRNPNFIRHVQDITASAPWEIVGVGEAKEDNAHAFFFVVKSNTLQVVRRAFRHVAPEWYDPAAQDFHITIGFIGKDVFPPAGGKGVNSINQELSTLVLGK